MVKVFKVIASIVCLFYVFFFKQKTAYEMRISDWSSDVCSSDLCHLRWDHGCCRCNGQLDQRLDYGQMGIQPQALRPAAHMGGAYRHSDLCHRPEREHSLDCRIIYFPRHDPDFLLFDADLCSRSASSAIGRAHVSHPLTNAILVC